MSQQPVQTSVTLLSATAATPSMTSASSPTNSAEPSGWLTETTSVTQTAILTSVFAAWILFAIAMAVFIARRRARMRRTRGTLADLESRRYSSLSYAVEYRPSTRVPLQDLLSASELLLLPAMSYAEYVDTLGAKSVATNDACAVCLDSYDSASVVRKLTCGHIFHPNCIDKWLLKRSCRCPLCNSDTRGLLDLPQRPSLAKLASI